METNSILTERRALTREWLSRVTLPHGASVCPSEQFNAVQREIEGIISGLSASQYAVLRKRYIDGKCWKVVADEMNMSLPWCKLVESAGVEAVMGMLEWD